MEILGIIPARGGSKGIKLKNLVKLNGKPLLFYTLNASKNSSYNIRTVVSTDNQTIENYTRKLGVQVIKRPKRLSGPKVSIESTIDHVLKILEQKENYSPDVILLLQNTSPLRSSKDIDSALKLLFKKNYDSILSGFNSHYFMWIQNNSSVHAINYDPKKRPNRQELKKQFIENGAIYATKLSSFKKSKCRISGKIGMYEMSESHSIDIDSPNDLFLAESVLKKYD
jgi:CMP-N,N'-diacetyllegionaminic acid synthase